MDRFEAYVEQKRGRESTPTTEPASTQDVLRYRLTTEVPDYWIPLVPYRPTPDSGAAPC